jgi:hypothetical protein
MSKNYNLIRSKKALEKNFIDFDEVYEDDSEEPLKVDLGGRDINVPVIIPSPELKAVVNKINNKNELKRQEAEQRLNKRKRETNLSRANISPIDIKDYETRIYLWLMDGWTIKRITDELTNKFGIATDATARRLINRVRNSYTLVEDGDMEELKARYLEMYGDLYSRSLAKKDLITAKGILDSVVKLQGLVTNKVEGKIENTFTVDFN